MVEPTAVRDGWIGWVLVAAVVAAWNGRALRTDRHECLSEFASRHFGAFLALGIGLALHFRRSERLSRYDPLSLAASRLRKVRP